MNMRLLVVLFACFSYSVSCLFSKYHRKCHLDPTAKQDIGSMEIERVPKYTEKFTYVAGEYHRKEVTYLPEQTTYIYNQFLGAGGSGEVYLVDLENWVQQNGKKRFKTQKRVLKRFFDQRPIEFEEENYIMDKLDYSVEWMRQLEPLPCDQCEEGQQPTLALYEHRMSKAMNDIDITDMNLAMVLYKICRQVEKAHRNGIVHNDIKMGNILITSEGGSYNAQLIDFNLATFFYPGHFDWVRKGTFGYWAPEQIFRTQYITPAADVFSLGVTFFRFLTQYVTPYKIKPKRPRNNALECLASLVGIDPLIDILMKYKYNIDRQVRRSLENIFQNPQKFEDEGIKQNLASMVPDDAMDNVDEEVLDLISQMLEPDPEYRITISEVLNHPYFNRVRKLPPMYAEKDNEKRRKAEEALKEKQDKNKEKIIPKSIMFAPNTPEHQEDQTAIHNQGLPVLPDFLESKQVQMNQVEKQLVEKESEQEQQAPQIDEKSSNVEQQPTLKKPENSKKVLPLNNVKTMQAKPFKTDANQVIPAKGQAAQQQVQPENKSQESHKQQELPQKQNQKAQPKPIEPKIVQADQK